MTTATDKDVKDKDVKDEESTEQLFDMAELADIVKQIVEEAAPAAMKEAIKPYVERSTTLEKYADSLIELERRKKEISTPAHLKGCEFARRVMVIALGKGNVEKGIHEARNHHQSNWDKESPTLKAMEKALTASNATAAGSMIPPAVAAEFIELLRNRSTMRGIARTLPMPFGSLTFRKQTAAATSTYVGESLPVNESSQTVGNVELNFKTLVTLTAVGNSLLRFGGPEVESMVRDDLLMSQGVREDLAFFSGSGEASTPKGVLNLVSAASPDHVVAQSGTTVADIVGDWTGLVKLVEAANVPLTEDSGHFVMHPSIYWGAYATAGSTEDATFALAPQLSNNRPFGFRVHRTVQTGAPGASTGYVYFLHGPSQLIGDAMSIDVEAFDGAAYNNSSGTIVSGVSQNETVIRAVSLHDFNMRHDVAAAVLTGVTVGA